MISHHKQVESNTEIQYLCELFMFTSDVNKLSLL